MHSIHLYVSRFNKVPAYYEHVRSGIVDSIDRVPQHYDYETQNIYLSFNCSKPLFISNQISILSANLRKEIRPTMQIWKSFPINVWILICFAFIFLMTADKILSKNKNHYSKSIYNIFWVYFKPLIGIGEHLRHNNLIYILWVISIRPLTEIFRNDLLANLIAVPDRNIDNIDDLLVNHLDVYTDGPKLGRWTGSSEGIFMKLLENNDYLKKFEQLFNKTKSFNVLQENWEELIDETDKMKKLVMKSALIEDDQSVEYFKTFLQKFISLHSGKESYIPKLITPLCYGPQFKFVKESEEV